MMALTPITVSGLIYTLTAKTELRKSWLYSHASTDFNCGGLGRPTGDHEIILWTLRIYFTYPVRMFYLLYA